MKLKRWIVTSLILLLWAAATAWLLRFEVFPEYFTRSLAGYRGLLDKGPMVQDTWMKILFRGGQIGYSHSSLETDEKDPAERYTVNNQSLLVLNIMGERQTVAITTQAALDALYSVNRFFFILSSGPYTARIEGRRLKDNRFEARVRTDNSTSFLRVEIPDDVVIYSPMMEMAMGQLKPGQEMRIKTFDPMSMATADVMVRALRTESIRLGDREADTTVLSIDLQGMRIHSWIDADGQLLRQETPFGWTLEACSADEALKADLSQAGETDLIRQMAVPCEGELREPRACRRLTVKLKGWSQPPGDLQTERQRVTGSDPAGVTLEIRAAKKPEPALAGAEIPEAARPFLAATPFIQSGHPDIKRRAREITRDATNPLEAALAIHRWVFRKVVKDPAVSLPSALDVLKQMKGDCNEHTYLYVALARAAGIPAQVRVGLVYVDGVFMFHAWPAVYVGEWHELDPTIGQDEVDATHLGLLEGELGSQMKLMGMVGQLSVEKIAEGYDDE